MNITLTDGRPINIGDIVFYVSNSGAAGIFKYQYMGVIKDVFTKNEYHLFLSEYMLSTITIDTRRVQTSISHKKLFSTRECAKKEVAKMRADHI